VEKRTFLTLQGLDLRPLGCPALYQSLYRLSYPGSCQRSVGGCIFADAVKSNLLIAEITVVSERDMS
jgi:hypothetical protein